MGIFHEHFQSCSNLFYIWKIKKVRENSHRDPSFLQIEKCVFISFQKNRSNKWSAHHIKRIISKMNTSLHILNFQCNCNYPHKNSFQLSLGLQSFYYLTCCTLPCTLHQLFWARNTKFKLMFSFIFELVIHYEWLGKRTTEKFNNDSFNWIFLLWHKFEIENRNESVFLGKFQRQF